MTWRRGRLVVAAGLTPLLLAALLTSSLAHGRSEESATWSPRRIGPSDPATPIDVRLQLRLKDTDVRRYLAGLDDPASPNYRRFLDPAGFGARFGLPLDQIAAVTGWLTRQGLSVVPEPDPQRTSLLVRGTVARLSDLFKVSLSDYVTDGGQRYHAPMGRPTIPAPIAAAVVAVAGLNSRLPDLGPEQAGGAAGYLTPNDIARAYDIKPLWDAKYRGDGVTVAIATFGSFNPDDIRAFDQQYGIQGAPLPAHMPVGNGVRLGANRGWDGETLLDVEMVRAVAPMATILDYEGSGTFGSIIKKIVTDGRATIVSHSGGFCDTQGLRNTGEWSEGEQELMAAKAVGVTVFASSGDTGAFTCQRDRAEDLTPTVSWPADSQYVIGVGGTRLSRATDGSYLEEAGWEDVLSGLGSGGGINPLDPIPGWQRGPGVQNSSSNGKRQVPDVAGPADPDDLGSDLGLVTYNPGTRGPEVSSGGNGTSQASPFWAGSLALVQEYAKNQGVPKLGKVADLLYVLASTTQPAPPFHDVVKGGNRLQACTPGWDFATGLGSPMVANLALDVVAYLKQHPA